jgi:hypothetical protein
MVRVDPKAEAMMGYTPDNAMANNPISFNAPEGDVPILVPIIAAFVGGGINVAANWKNINSFGDGLAAFGIGAGAAVAGVFAAPSAVVGATAGLTIGSYAAAGTLGGVVGGFVEGTGNALYFGDITLEMHLDWVCLIVLWGYWWGSHWSWNRCPCP